MNFFFLGTCFSPLCVCVHVFARMRALHADILLHRRFCPFYASPIEGVFH